MFVVRGFRRRFEPNADPAALTGSIA
jgi:hypothetical protein